MPFREKTTWLTLATMVVAYGIYFSLIAASARHGAPPLVEIVWTFGAVTICQVAVVIAGTILLAVTATKDARARADERDRAIARRAASVGYYVLLVGMILVGVVMPFSYAAWEIINSSLAAIVLAEVVRNAIILLSYRRGWHG
jgi:hypothetical protein